MRHAPLLLALSLGVGLPGAVTGQDRLSRTFAHEHGLTAPPVWALAQDSLGFLWIGAEAGLFRFDGARMRQWAPDVIQSPVVRIAAAAGRLVTVDVTGQAFDVSGSGARPLELPAGSPSPCPRPSGSVAIDGEGGLWLLCTDTLLHLAADGRTTALGAAAFGGERLRLVLQTAYGGALIATDTSLWRVRPDATPRHLFSGRIITDVVEPDPGRVVILLNTPAVNAARVVQVEDGIVRELLSTEDAPGGRAISIRERGGTVWVALDRWLVAVRPGQRPVHMGKEEGVESGGPLLVDREGSLWLGSFVGLHQYPEPETQLWAERQGLPSRHTRFLARAGQTVWVMTWAGPGLIRQSADGFTAAPADWWSRSNICADGRGSAWTASGDSVIELRDTIVARWLVGRAPRVDGCTPARGGGVWLGTQWGLLHVGSDRGVVHAVPPPPIGSPDAARPALLHDSQDRVWVGADASICHAPAPQILAGDAGWQCTEMAGPGWVTGMVELPDGQLWASSDRQGLLMLDGEQWRPRPIEGAPTRTVFALVPSPRGGVWVVGSGILMRVRDGGDETLTVLETLTSWHGLPGAGGSDLVEDDDGTIWLATGRGVYQIPGAVRFAGPSVPPIALVDARIDDAPITIDAPLVLPYDRNRLELNFAALTFRDRSLVRHQVRLGPSEPWTGSRGEPSFRWVDLRPGDHQVEYRASLDGENWSTEPIHFAFSIRSPWYRSTWFVLLATAFVALAAWGIYRARLAYLLGLERQRTRIAMDLHDEVGSGLASVGILSGVLAGDGLDAAVRRTTAAHIAAAAEDLGNALSDIVWSLDPRTATMEELASRLAEHGERLCAAGHTSFSAHFPSHWPADRPVVAVRRNVLLIGLEALHNAVRHAGAGDVTLSLVPAGRGAWMLSIQDDGVGLPAAPEQNGRSGRGLAGMRRRADEIGALLDVRSDPGLGTALTLRFRSVPPSSAHRMIMRVRQWR
jgi:signal transduction histidine kinase